MDEMPMPANVMENHNKVKSHNINVANDWLG